VIHLEGNNAPVPDERDAVPTRVVGRVPDDLRGTYYRNGPNPRSGWSPHLFAGEGMVHAVALASGAYRNRYVEGNTHVIEHDGALLTLEEGKAPHAVTDALGALGPFDFAGSLPGTMTAHPKRCPVTGDLLFFAYWVRSPFLTYHRWSMATGSLLSQPVELPVCSMMHDFAVTETRVVFFDSPFVFDGSPWRWDADHGARVGVMSREGGDVRWHDVATSHLSHSANAWDDGETIVLTGTRLAGPESLPVMHEWRIGADGVREHPLDDSSTEYPRVPDALVGRPNRYTYTSSFFYVAEPDHGEVNKHDGDRRETRRLPLGHTCGEPVFVARADSRSEDDGYLLTFAHDRGAGTSYLLILDAGSLDTIAEVHLPVRVPAGFHGSWVPTVTTGTTTPG
jgi:carotenoid cleavage dioxygenase-like enzyme